MINGISDNLDRQTGNSLLKKPSERNSNFELLRIISMIMIISFHAQRSIDVSQLSMINRGMIGAISSWGLLGVDLFVIISAWFLSDQRFRMSKLLSLMFEVFTYILAFSLISVVWNTYKTGSFKASLLVVLKHHASAFLTPFWSSEYWFITAYVFMLILSPFINKLYELLDKKYIKTLLIICSFIPVYSTFNGGDVIKDVIIFCYIYFLVSYLKRTDFSIKKKSQKILPYVLMVLIIAGKSLVAIVSHYIALLDNNLIKYIFSFIRSLFNATLLNSGRHSIIMLIVALLLFFSLKDIKPFYSKFINLISSCTLGVYLFHENTIFNICNMFIGKAVQIGFIQFNILFPLTYIAVILVIFVLGTIFEFVRFQILQKPFNKLLKCKSDKFKKTEDFINFISNAE